MSTIADNTADTLHSVGDRVHDVTSSMPANLLPSGVEWPTDLVDRVTDDLADGLGALGDAIGPATTVAVDAGTRAAVAGGRSVRRHPVLVAGGVVGLVAAIVWFARRRRTADTAAVVPRAANGAGAVDAA